MYFMLFERQAYQEKCVSNIIKALEFTDGLENLSGLKEGIGHIQNKENILVKTYKDDYRLDVLMETGTGKTFTYLKAMYEMNKEFGMNKFVIFVPRLAIRAGIIQNINLTSDYFFQEYGKRIKRHSYEGELSSVNSYTRNRSELSLLILTSASIASKDSNGNDKSRVLSRKSNENSLFPNMSPLEAIASLRPVVFLDEPHLLKGDKFVKAYEDHFSNLLLLRFGATFPNNNDSKLSNVIYSLDSITALRSHLVKKIRVASLDDTRFDIRFSKILNAMEVEASYPNENVEEHSIIEKGDDIGAITGIRKYTGVFITKIDVKAGKIFLSNHTTHTTSNYTLDEETIRAMVKATIERHFKKEETLFKEGIKTLSLFFIPSIKDFRGNGNGAIPLIKNIFEKEYQKIRRKIIKTPISKEYKAYLDKDIDEEDNLCVHQGYFSGDSESDEKIGKQISKILSDKTRLLSTQEPLRFIFSVWALQEGWDNPNIFNICKLNSTGKEISRRQQVGRGLRLAVNDKGVRQTIKLKGEHFYDINVLDMIVSSQEGDFIKDIQDEIRSNSFVFGGRIISSYMLRHTLNREQADDLITFLKERKVIEFSSEQNVYIVKEPPIKDFIQENKKALPQTLTDVYDKIIDIFEVAMDNLVKDGNKINNEIGIRQKNLKEFKELWETISRKAKIVYKNIQEETLAISVSEAFNKETIAERKIISTEKIYHHESDTIEAIEERIEGEIEFFKKRNSYNDFILSFSKRENLPISFTLKLFNKLDDKKIKNDPNRAEKLLSKILGDELHRSVVESIGYEFNGDISIEANNVFFDEKGNPITKISTGKIGKFSATEEPAEHYLYDKVCYDSKIEERASVKSSAAKKGSYGTIKVFAKLPRISIPTPSNRKYNPDFAYYIEGKTGKKIFFIAETKGYDSENDIPKDERDNIEYAKKFFHYLNEEVGDDINIIFKQRINKQNLVELLQDIGTQT